MKWIEMDEDRVTLRKGNKMDGEVEEGEDKGVDKVEIVLKEMNFYIIYLFESQRSVLCY